VSTKVWASLVGRQPCNQKDYWEVNVIISIQVRRKLILKEGNDFLYAA